jgi:nucleoside-diphosphate-sugar epimerase
MRFLITGATGFVGGHVVEACLERDQQVSALVRPTSNATELAKRGVTLYRGELSDIGLVRSAVTEADVIVHCAAKVGDWGPVDDYRAVNVECLRVLLDACKGQALTRFIDISSLGVYAARHHYGTDEAEPLPRYHRDGYSQSKMEAEQLAMRYYHDFGVPVVVLRPGFIYGPRDPVVLPRLIEGLKRRAIRYPGSRGATALNTIYVGNLVHAIFLAIESEQAVGQVYNLTDGEAVSKRRFVGKIADAMGLPHPHLMPPYWLAFLVTWCIDKAARLRGAKRAPEINFTRLKFLGLNLDFSIDKARTELGYRPRWSFDDGMVETLDWYKKRQV